MKFRSFLKPKAVEIGKPVIFSCQPHSRVNSLLSYNWGNRYKNSSEDFNIETDERVWITTHGELVFSVFEQKDFDMINKKGIRCIIVQDTLSKRIQVMSNVFKVALQGKFFFLEM